MPIKAQILAAADDQNYQQENREDSVCNLLNEIKTQPISKGCCEKKEEKNILFSCCNITDSGIYTTKSRTYFTFA